MLHEFRPTILFLAKFFIIYLLGSTGYGFYIAQYDSLKELDPCTRLVCSQCASIAEICGYETEIVKNDHLRYESKSEKTFDSLWLDTKYVISIEEGCNGLNIMILFFAFVVGFGGKLFNMLVFIPTGIIFIHVANLARLLLLSLLNVNSDGRAFHFFHKYGFTAILYVAILFLWYLWVMRWNGRNFAKDDILKNEEDF